LIFRLLRPAPPQFGIGETDIGAVGIGLAEIEIRAVERYEHRKIRHIARYVGAA
jgi:hypothetical protein